MASDLQDLPDKRGFVLLWRKAWDNPILKEPGKPFSKREAWFHICSVLANGKERDGIPRGEFQVSYRYLARAWCWNVAKTHRFIAALIAAGMLEKVKHQMKQEMEHLKVCNYTIYNPVRNANCNTKCNKSNKGIKQGLKETTTADEKPFILVPLKTGEDFPISETMTAEYEAAYPNIDVRDNLRRYRAWALSNPGNRKTKAGILRSVNGWLSREAETSKAQSLLAGITSKLGAE